jgi:hypothetical protein
VGRVGSVPPACRGNLKEGVIGHTRLCELWLRDWYEIHPSDPADCYNGFLKFLLAHNLGLIAVGVEIVYDDSVGGRNIPRLSKVQRDLEVYRSVLACPVWVVGLREGS